MLRAAPTGRFRPEFLFQPQSVSVIGAGTALGAQILANLHEAGFQGRIEAADDVAGLPHAPELAVIATAPDAVLPAVLALEARGTRAAIAAAQGGPEAWPHTACRVLGPASFGIIVPALGLNASSAHLQPRPGRLALVSQSAALCRAVIDWAEPNGVGFSHVVGTGGNRDLGFAAILDWLSRDPGTGAILLDIRTIRDRRAFLSAARAAARLRPVVAIHAGGRQHDPTGREDLVFGAALRRAGILRVTGMAELLAAAETLTRARPPRSDALMVATNAVGPGQMAADQAVRLGIPLAAPDVSARSVMQLTLPPQPNDAGLVWTGSDQPTRVAEAAAMLSALPEVGGVVAILAPTGPADAAGVAALAAAYPSLKLPLLACVLGETTGAAHRRTLAEAGVPVFASPEQAVRGFAQLVQQRRARVAARELPSSRVLDLAPDQAAARQVIAAARAQGRTALVAAEAWAVFAAYGIAGPAPGHCVTVHDDPLFGPAIGIAPHGSPGAEALDLLPLNLALAAGLTARPGIADILVQLSQLVIDVPEIAALRLDADPALTLRPPGERGRLSIAPYPAELAECWGGLQIRPIRPEDAAAHAALFRRLSPEDIRYRFFSMLRELSPEQVARMTQVDYEREMAFVASEAGQTVGVARLVRELPGTEAEFAVVVSADMKGRGLGRRLMQRLIDWGRSQGITAINGQVLADNAPMLAFMRRLGFTIRRLPGEADVVVAEMELLDQNMAD